MLRYLDNESENQKFSPNIFLEISFAICTYKSVAWSASRTSERYFYLVCNLYINAYKVGTVED